MSSTEAVLLERIHSTIDRIDTKTVELQNSINDKLAYVPPPAQGKVRQGWDDFCAFMRRIWDKPPCRPSCALYRGLLEAASSSASVSSNSRFGPALATVCRLRILASSNCRSRWSSFFCAWG
ncbi:hypothetical protein [Paractinoplanes hotanensis]|uniref:Uncharacterized protein n=1 Tax=Paractinoplanes hotanensis TaxID=2906497 RepID=A0ABT0YAI4_9ACTN|nr:hypothetical protein [Actinoplanes hotanensis]MCM4083048.1 hypothetical protein [Actinoplanes hotanensis]